MTGFAELGRDEHAGAGDQLQARLADRQNGDDVIEIDHRQRKHFLLAALLFRHLRANHRRPRVHVGPPTEETTKRTLAARRTTLTPERVTAAAGRGRSGA